MRKKTNSNMKISIASRLGSLKQLLFVRFCGSCLAGFSRGTPTWFCEKFFEHQVDIIDITALWRNGYLL